MLRLNVGCGNNVLDGYENIDLFVDNPRVKKYDIRNLPYQTETVDEILAEDILEHFPRMEWRTVLKEWIRTIKKDGLIELRFPEMTQLCEKLCSSTTVQDWEFYNRKIFGGQGDGRTDGQGMFHYTGFSFWFLKKILEDEFNLKYVKHSFHNFNCLLVMKK